MAVQMENKGGAHMNCGEFRERIDDYMDGLLDEALHARMDAHAGECTQCAGLLKQAMEIKAALAELDDEAPVPAEVSAAWRRAVKVEAERRRRARVWRGWRTFAAAAAALAIWVGATALLGNAGMLDRVVGQEDGIAPAAYSVTGTLAAQQDEDEEAAAYLEADGDNGAGGMLLGSARTASGESGGAQRADEAQSSLRTKLVTGQILCENFDTDLANLDDLVSEVDGYYETEMDSEAEGVPSAQRTIRVPMEELDAFLGGLSAVGKPVNLVKTEEDLTQRYSEVNARLTTLTAQRDQYNQLIEQAASAEEIETLAGNAQSAQEQIDTLEAAIREWDTACEYATVNLSLSTQAVPAGSASGTDAALGARMGTAFSQALDFLQDMLVSLAYLAPAILGVAIVAIAVALVRKSRKNHKGGETT